MKRLLLSTIALLMLSVLLIAPIKAKTVEPYLARIEMKLVDPGKQWVSEDGILHIRGAYWRGTESSSLGINNKFEHWMNDDIDLATGKGTLSGPWLLTIEGRGTFSGSGVAKMSMGYLLSGIFIGTHGTGEFDGWQKKGTFEGYVDETQTYVVMDCVGEIIYP